MYSRATGRSPRGTSSQSLEESSRAREYITQQEDAPEIERQQRRFFQKP